GVAVVGDHEAAQNGSFDVRVVRSLIDVAEQLQIVLGAVYTQVFDGFQLNVGIGGALRHLRKEVVGLGRPALSQHKQRVLLEPRRTAALQELLEYGHAAVGVGFHEASQSQELEVFIGNVLGRGRLPFR